MKKISTCVLLLLSLGFVLPLSAQDQESTKIRFNAPQNPNGFYTLAMLELAISRLDKDYEIELVEGGMTQARTIDNVTRGVLDIMSAATNEEMEELLQPIRIPLFKGLLGHRIFIIHRDNQALFDRVETFEDLKHVTFGQGARWADTQILEHNGLTVVKVNKFPSLFYMVDGERFDAFPRGVNEPFGEVVSWNTESDLELAVEKRLMLVYRMPFYMYTSKNRPQLAADLERGLNLAIADGGFDELFFSNETVQDVLQKANLSERLVFPLDNPTLPTATPVERSELWLDVSAL
ncbi:diguanylate cyclase [Marinimicrobium sp. ABcell2]|uniref:diguanylate cyclase n=1 Tax=Marinimicrobium sp. ABcell2 TaxID=3069751 RepID=UPI0027B26766|nr:diguanylate cyclase [Marinimicrobium sp. ABcell2]MDQ2076898.1 diguanylate cyclase [Marinimicrobium sp. ABcell2]